MMAHMNVQDAPKQAAENREPKKLCKLQTCELAAITLIAAGAIAFVVGALALQGLKNPAGQLSTLGSHLTQLGAASLVGAGTLLMGVGGVLFATASKSHALAKRELKIEQRAKAENAQKAEKKIGKAPTPPPVDDHVDPEIQPALADALPKHLSSEEFTKLPSESQEAYVVALLRKGYENVLAVGLELHSNAPLQAAFVSLHLDSVSEVGDGDAESAVGSYQSDSACESADGEPVQGDLNAQEFLNQIAQFVPEGVDDKDTLRELMIQDILEKSSAVSNARQEVFPYLTNHVLTELFNVWYNDLLGAGEAALRRVQNLVQDGEESVAVLRGQYYQAMNDYVASLYENDEAAEEEEARLPQLEELADIGAAESDSTVFTDDDLDAPLPTPPAPPRAFAGEDLGLPPGLYPKVEAAGPVGLPGVEDEFHDAQEGGNMSVHGGAVAHGAGLHGVVAAFAAADPKAVKEKAASAAAAFAAMGGGNESTHLAKLLEEDDTYAPARAASDGLPENWEDLVTNEE
jgi:hypothetical protein